MNLGLVLLRCWPEVLLCADVVRVGNDIKRSSPLISAGVLSSEGLCSSQLALLRQLTSTRKMSFSVSVILKSDVLL